NGSGIKNVTVTGLPDYLEYDSTTNSIKFKSGKEAVEKLPENTPSQEFTLNIRAEDKAGNVSERTAKITVSSMSTKTNPTPIPQNTSYGQVPDPNASVDKAGLPDGTKVTWKTPPVVNTPGATAGEVEITYPDGSKDVVTVNVTVRKVSEDFTATGTPIEVNQNVSVTPEMLKGAVTATNAQGENGNSKIATVESKTPINTEAYGDQTIQVKVTYIDGSEQDVTIPLKVKDVTNPTIQTPAENTNWEMTALDKTLPPMKIEAKDNANGSGIATIEVRNMPSFLTFDQASGTIVFKEGVLEVPRIDSDNVMHGVTIVARDKAGNSTSKLVNITVSSMRGKYSPTAIAQEVDNGHVPDPETSVNKTGLPEGTTVTWKTRPDVSTPGSHPGVALVHYPDGTEDEVEVPVTVKKQSDTFNPTAKQPNQTVRHNEVPDPEKSINTNDLPKGTNYSWSEQPDTSKPGSKTGKVLITYPDKSTEEVTVTVEVTPQKDDYDPQPKTQTVEHAQVPSAKDSIENVKTLPEGTTFGWKDGKIPDTSKHGEKKGVVTVTYPDGSTEDVDVVITVNPEDFSPVVPMEKVPVKNPENLSPEEQDKVKEKVTKANPGKDVTVDSKGNVTITDPETKVSHEISRDKLVFAYAKGEPETSEIPEFNGGVNAPDSPIHEVPEFAGGVNGEPETQEILPEFNGGANTPNSPTHEVPEFNGGVNGELPNPVEVSKIQLMITKWVDENGKELKPADAKAPKVLGEANEAFEHGEIEGYVFVRTETKGDVVTHIFRKVSPVRPTGDGQQRPVTPSDDTNPRPDIATPAEVPATQPTVQPSQTVAVPAQLQNEVSETNPSVSQTQAVLPNTGVQEDRTTGAVGVLSLLGAFGLLFAKKKKDDEEEA
uniref:SIALI-17 repeat-containing surface protein n=1 Tax=Streptococcus mitis TaxID=28037 RepID=UPI0009B96010